MVGILVSVLGVDLSGYLMIAPPVTCILLFGGFVLLARTVDQIDNAPAYLGLGKTNRPRLWLVGALIGTVLVCLIVAAMFAAKAYVPGPTRVHLSAIAVVIWSLLWAGLSEELAFRSYPFARLSEAFGWIARSRGPRSRRELGGWMAGTCTGLLFGAVHLYNPHASWIGFVNTTLIGVFFAVFMMRTNSLWLLWGLHFSWNMTLGLILGLPVSGLRIFSVIHEASTPGPQWLTGGFYGIEASATATAIILLAIVVVARLASRADAPDLSGIQNGVAGS
jgi:hypothetical protein